MRPDLVIGLSHIPAVLADARVPHRVDSALDLCTGSGVQALRMTGQARKITVTDLNPRALAYAATCAALSGQDWELLQGSMAEPVAGRRFDMVIANPPFVVKPGGVDYTYRDNGLPLDSLAATLAAHAPDLLNPDGYMQYFCSWIHPEGGDWTERVHQWAAATGLDALVVQLGDHDPLTYVQMWSDGHGSTLEEQADWYHWLRAQHTEAVGWGLVTLRNSGRTQPRVHVMDLPGGHPTGADIHAWFERDHQAQAASAQRTSALDARYKTAAGLTLTQHAVRDPQAGWQVTQHTLHTPALTLGSHSLATQLLVDLVEACDGTRTLREITTQLATGHGHHPDHFASTVQPALQHLLDQGILQPA